MPHGTHALAAVTSTKAAGFILRKKPLHINTVSASAGSTVVPSDLAGSGGAVRPRLLAGDTASIPVQSTNLCTNLSVGQT
jgi:hypothetical protein